MNPLTCRVFDIVRGSTHDGPGMRTTVFLKGCPLRCAWCQNPEGIRTDPEVSWDVSQCIRCLECVNACPEGALSSVENGLFRDRAMCTACGTCVETCPAQAMEYTAGDWNLDELTTEVLKDREYYRSFGGGVTVSGGEPLLQGAFVAGFFQKLHAEGVHTALDTCGAASGDVLTAVLPSTDHVLFDLKLMHPKQHKQFTGQSNERILHNLIQVVENVRARRGAATSGNGRDLTLWIRTPLIPGTTDGDDNLAAIGSFLAEHAVDAVERWELCAFNNACTAKYKKLALPWEFEGIPLLNQERVDTLKQQAIAGGFPRDKLVTSGLIARPNRLPKNAQ
ncbi:MAG: glycyl-radical enzyme activating protein [Candidatus Pacebacteria bacterium]|nr:glycyl-radical enzyme activating protein [Candidatus Paceibacterota bacterium]